MSILPNSLPAMPVASTNAPRIKLGAIRSLRPALMCTRTVFAPARLPLRIGFGTSNVGRFLVAASSCFCTSAASSCSGDDACASSSCASASASSDDGCAASSSSWVRVSSVADARSSLEVGTGISVMSALVYREMSRISISCFLPLRILYAVPVFPARPVLPMRWI